MDGPLIINTVHKVDGPNQGQTYKSVKWTDPTKGQTRKSTKWTDPTKGQTYKSTKWTDPTRAKLIQIQKVNGPNRDQTCVKKKKKKRTDPTDVQNPDTHNGRTQPVHKIIQVHNVDSYQGSRPHSTE